MTTATVTTKGQIVIPAEIRRLLKIKKGTKVSIRQEGDKILLQPLTPDFYDKTAGILKSPGKTMTRMLLEERAKEKELEEKKIKKWLKS